MGNPNGVASATSVRAERVVFGARSLLDIEGAKLRVVLRPSGGCSFLQLSEGGTLAIGYSSRCWVCFVVRAVHRGSETVFDGHFGEPYTVQP